MADTFYSWSNFKNVKATPDKPGVDIAPGDKVSPSILGVSQEEFDAFVESGAVRNRPYPDMGTFPGSPREFMLAKLAQAADDSDLDLLTATELPAGDPPGEPTK